MNPNQLSTDTQNLISQITSASQAPAQAKYIQYTPADLQTSSPSDLIQRAYNELKPYYSKLLQDAQGDLNTAKGYLEEDYQQGLRYLSEDVQTSMKQFGMQFPQEQENLQENLNKRGVALTQNQDGQVQVGGQGEAGNEMKQLSEDQQLRQEAVQRTSQRQTAQLGQTRQRGLESATRQNQQYGQQLQQDLESQAASRAGLYSGLEQAANAGTLQNKINQTTPGLGTGTGGTSTSAAINPSASSNFMDYYKGWDPAGAQADYTKTYGGDLTKLQASKPL